MALRVLIVDDHPAVRTGVRTLLTSHPNWEVCSEAASGAEAITRTDELKPDVIVLDVTMPGMNGFEAARVIHTMAPRTRIVFFSMHNVPWSARQAGGDEFVCKSDAPRELIAAIERVEHTLDSSAPDKSSAAPT